ncbi:MAG TPA: patatin-like phospholipase family protein [Nocardioidaceae bacterium]|nr:patatin-like phospholipase family protein [Nocardioidaceae bacterium]
MAHTAFVLGGGGLLGAAEVGMLRALFETGVRPDLILGTSVGALNGALVAAHPGPDVVDRLVALWLRAAAGRDVYGDGPVKQMTRAVRTGTHLYSSRPLRNRLAAELGERTFADLTVPFQCCAASIERACEHWFTTGRVVDAVVASAAVPGLLGPALVDGEHYLDGGIVNSIPVGRAVECGASRIFVLHVGRVDRPLRPPTKPWDVARVSFEIARRHRFHKEMADLPDSVEAFVLPTGASSSKDDSLLAYRDFRAVTRRIDTAYAASATYLRNRL